jgi:hypothetical protein
VQRIWIQVALAALAGLGSLALCCGAFVAIVSILLSEGDLVIIPLYLRTQAVYWIGLVTAVLFAGAGLSLPALALGARWEDALKPTVLSSPVFGAFVFFFLLSLDSRYGFVAGAISLMALVGTSVVGSLVTLQEEEGHSVAVRLGRVTVIAAGTIYCASLLAYSLYWLVPRTSPCPVFLLRTLWPLFHGPYCRVSWRCYAPVDVLRHRSSYGEGHGRPLFPRISNARAS